MSKKGAGFIVVKKIGSKWKVLGLKTKSYYDLPKGACEKEDKNIFQTAVRECEEECSIKISASDVLFGGDNIVIGPLTVFIAKTSQTPKIKRNKKSGIIEHEGFKWLEFDELERNAIPYLRPVINWASNKMGF